MATASSLNFGRQFNGPTVEHWKKQGLDKINARLAEIDQSQTFKDYRRIEPKKYGETYTVSAMIPRIMTVALFIIAIVVYALAASGRLTSLPPINYTHLAIGGGVMLCLVAGASAIIHYARKDREYLLAPLAVTYEHDGQQIKVDSVTKVPDEKVTSDRPDATERCLVIEMKAIDEGPKRGALTSMNQHLEPALLKYKSKKNGSRTLDGYIDTSILDKQGNGRAFVYNIKTPSHHYTCTSIIAILGTPAYLVGVIVYNALRAIIVPFYIIYQLIKEAWKGKPSFPKEREFEVADIGRQFIQSIVAIVQAPFYALAYWMSSFYALINPMGGDKLLSAIERDWNGGEILSRSYWSTQGGQIKWAFEGGGGPLGLEGRGRKGRTFVLAGCSQPFGIAEFKDGVVTGYWYTVLKNPNVYKPFSVTTLSQLERDIIPLNKERAILEQAKQELRTGTK